MKPISLTALAGALTVCSLSLMAQAPVPGSAADPASPASPALIVPSETNPMPAPAVTSPAMPAAPSVVSPAMPAAPAAPTPEPIIVETKVDLTTEPGPPADPRAAREEAVNALHWAKTEGCRSDPSPRDCVRRAQAEYSEKISQLGRR